LAQSSPADFTAIYEALDVSVHDSESDDDSKEQDLDKITIKTLKSFIARKRSEIPYELTSDITSRVWIDGTCYETVKNPEMYGHEGKIIFEFSGDVVINAFWVSETVQYDELDHIIQDIRKTTGLTEQELYIDELYWTDNTEKIQYYIKYHEGPLVIGVKKM
jgi:hypothetical protein